MEDLLILELESFFHNNFFKEVNSFNNFPVNGLIILIHAIAFHGIIGSLVLEPVPEELAPISGSDIPEAVSGPEYPAQEGSITESGSLSNAETQGKPRCILP